jgi:hypothetical protein
MNYAGKQLKWYGKIGYFLLLVENIYPIYIVFANFFTSWTNSAVEGVGFGGFVQRFL